ncbi:putative gustatory receptor clone PTE01 [Onychostoma macrolepis]|uniref:putative gustatory receptor clone PTE01 n=1 Tax=Onychostoma macrolepis TaxID=369639 RepID=UPI0027297411|nr:putative gustatory receptor clone PTE01 [Onychostoma macrolepis]
MENLSIIVSFELTLDPVSFSPGAKYPIFLFGMFIYMFGAFCNLTLLLLIILTQSLHKPAYFILLNLPLNDLMGITFMLPKVLYDIVTETNNTYYPLCVLQGFLLHMYGSGVLFILSAMAFDRYIAICMPLRYNALMTPRVVMTIVALVWGVDFLLICTVFSLQGMHLRCRSHIVSIFCDNPSLVKLACGNTIVNNIFGLFTSAITQIISVSIHVFSYVKILITCLLKGRSDAKNKAINTCVAQLVIFITFEVVGVFYILSHRFSNVNANLQKIMGILIFLVPPIMNPIVYGLNSHEIRKHFLKIFHRKISA